MLVRVMGLTIHYQIRLKASDTESGYVDALQIVKRAQAFARKLERQRLVAGVGEITSSAAALAIAPVFNRRFNQEHGWGWKPAFPEAGWLFQVDIGDGCESLRLGLCRYPYAGPYIGPRRWAKLHSPEQAVWRLEGFCKTQYASRHGWEHFRRCHVEVIELLEHWRTFGASVQIKDEGGFWPRYSENKLRRNIVEYDQCIAAFGGALKDAAGECGETIEAPIFNHPQFEQLEAQGMAEHGGKIGRAVEIVKRATS